MTLKVNFFKKKRDGINEINEDIKTYIEHFEIRNEKRIHINKDYTNQLKTKCPTCRKTIKMKQKPMCVYVQTDCVICLQTITKSVILSCKHANVCKRCYKKMIKDPYPYPSLFNYSNNEPVKVTREQLNLYKRKTSLGYEW